MKPPSAASISSVRAFHALLVTLTISSAHALDWDGAAGGTGASDGGGNWNAGNVWWNGTASGSWVDGSSAVFGAGGLAGTVNLQGGTYTVSGLQFKAVTLADVTDPPPTVVRSAYTLSNGRTNIATGGSITIASAATGSDPADRIKFNQIIGGNDVTITHTGGPVFYQLGGANQWTGNYTIDATNGGNSQFVEIKTPSAISTLTNITVESGNTLSMAASGTFTGPAIAISGTGASSRGALRIDATSTLNNNVTLSSNARIATINDGIVATLAGSITGASQLDQNSSGAVGTLIYSGTSTFNELLVSKGNAQIGAASAGSITGNVTASGATAVVTGTGTVIGNLNVTTGMVKPGDHSGTGIAGAGMGVGTLNVNGSASLSLAAAGTAAEFQMGLAASDRLAVTGDLTLNGTSTIVGLFASGYTPAAGNTWNLITYGGTLTQGSFDLGTNFRTGADSAGNEGNLNLPDVSSNGLLWNVALANGALTATLVVPEPSAALLFGGSCTFLALRRRKVRTPKND